MADKVLIVDDLPDNVFLLKEVVAFLGFKAESRKNGKEALEALTQDTYKIIFMDLEMPVMSGFEATEVIRKTLDKPLCDIPIFAISAHPRFFFDEKDRLRDFTDYVSKPYTLDKIRTILSKYNLL
jgi:two-component system CheB/CheR fusion protein